jgi:fused signal recognition particle receptor
MWDLLKSKVSNFIKQVKDENKEELEKEIPVEKEIIDVEEKEKVEILEEEDEKEREEEKVILEEKKERIIEEEIKPEIIEKKVEIEVLPKFEEKKKVEIKEKKPEQKMNLKVGLKEKITKTLLRKIKLNKNKVNEITEELEMALIQADVHPEIAVEVCEKINQRLVKSEYSSKNLEEEIKNDLREIFQSEVFTEYPKINVLELIKNNQDKPYKILFVGPNGAGKTTTIAKFANMIKNEGKKVVISASDTFRAAAIEQTEEHGKRLNVKVIRQNYGADAAAVAFDAIKHAEANDVDVVLIDSAGRQDNNTNLMRELEKIKRITKPNITIFIGEAIAGNSLYQQVETYNEIVKLNGIILTKVDCDAKGGAAISIFKESNIPIIYLGMGQKYEDLKLFEPKDIIDNII